MQALDLGADDYVVKPFALPELLARVRVGLRHAEREASGARVEASRLTRGPIEIDTASREVRVRGEAVVLTPTQYDLLLCFARHPGRVLTHRMIVAEVWGDPDAVGRPEPARLRLPAAAQGRGRPAPAGADRDRPGRRVPLPARRRRRGLRRGPGG